MKIRSIATGAAWSYSSQFVTTLAQLLYTSFTSRLVSEIGFGDYAIALVASSLFTIVATGGLDQVASRLSDLGSARVPALLYLSLGFGFIGGLFLFLLAPVLAVLWGSESASSAIAVMAAGVTVSPAAGYCSGLLRRQGRFRPLALLTLVANLCGMSLGLMVVFSSQTAASLLIFPIISLLLVLFGGVALNHAVLFRRPNFGAAAAELDFGWRVVGNRLLVFLERAVVSFGLSRSGGVEILGQWNRAEVLTLIPIQQVQIAVQQSVYWDLRATGGVPERARRVWTDSLILVAWVATPLAVFGAYFAPLGVPILFGPGWDLAAHFSAFVAVSAGIQMVASLLAVGLEATARFRPILISQLGVLAVVAAGALIAIITVDYGAMVVGVILAPLVRHGFQLMFAIKAGLIATRSLVRGYSSAVLFSFLFALCPLVATHVLAASNMTRLIFGLVILVVFAFIVFVLHKRLPPWKIVQSYRE